MTLYQPSRHTSLASAWQVKYHAKAAGRRGRKTTVFLNASSARPTSQVDKVTRTQVLAYFSSIY